MNCRLMIVAGCWGGRSFLKDIFSTRPFRIVNVGQYNADNDLYLMVMSASPGLLDKDHYEISIKLESGTRLQLQSQAYQRLFKMVEGATQRITITLERGSVFSYSPHPVVPHQNSKFNGHTVVHLGEDCRLLLSEIVTCGRKHSGEIFRFTSFQNLTEVYHQNILVVKDNIFLSPGLLPLCTIGMLGNYTHQGSLIYISTGKESISAHVDVIRELMQEEEGVDFGISKISANGFVLRVLAQGGEQLYNCFRNIQNTLWRHRVHEAGMSNHSNVFQV